MLTLELDAPFAAFRPVAAGWHRPTARMLTPSAAYGLLLNVARIETRLPEHHPDHPGGVPTTLHRPGLPAVRIAVGLRAGYDPPAVQTIFQQSHTYPLDNSKMDDPLRPGQKITKQAEGRRRAKGVKSHITPIRWEFLSGLHAVLAVDGDTELEDRVRRGLRGELNEGRYGVPFLGDNAFLVDRLQEPPGPPPARWFLRVEDVPDADRLPHVTRLTIWIDRADMTRTRSALFAPAATDAIDPPPAAWSRVPGEPA